MVDQDETGGLVVRSVFTPQALGAASHIVALDPQAAVALAAWLETTASGGS
ncbi:hypothetical protein [Lentzea guizhouensis]|uniref:hypothetical protein n=1 Tax=Lentzea guizhouensis TaxID=1586287 RepID=UPI000A57AA58|nr:hypothetical protein [Lentzea guizhouensis]